ncbi:MAG: hypothetical protein HQL65_04920 [Magnetococcales bacterium]|nr:hypothetical protein [Magnetococcales bacterium]
MPTEINTHEQSFLVERWDGFGFDLRTSVRYHQRRMMFFDRWNSVTNAVVLFSGSSAVINLLTESFSQKVAIIVFGGIVSIFALLDLVVGTARMARTHEILYRQYIDLECQWTAIHAPTMDELLKLQSDKLRLEQGEPPPLITLSELCWNDTARSMGRDWRIVGITRMQKLFANLWSFEDPSHQRKHLQGPASVS